MKHLIKFIWMVISFLAIYNCYFSMKFYPPKHAVDSIYVNSMTDEEYQALDGYEVKEEYDKFLLPKDWWGPNPYPTGGWTIIGNIILAVFYGLLFVFFVLMSDAEQGLNIPQGIFMIFTYMLIHIIFMKLEHPFRCGFAMAIGVHVAARVLWYIDKIAWLIAWLYGPDEN